MVISRSYDTHTREAVRRFQDGADILPANGLADERTRDAINARAVEQGLQEATEAVRRREIREGQQQTQPEQERESGANQRQGVHHDLPAPSGESMADRYLASILSGDSRMADHLASEFALSKDGHDSAQASERLLAQQHASDQQSQDRQMAR